MTAPAAIAPAATTTWNIDPTHTAIGFTAKHMMITTVRGRFNEVSGTITTADADTSLCRADVTIGVASVDTGVAQRDEHLRSGDFFDAAQFPAITFASRRVEGTPANPGDTFTLVGDLTIRGVTREVALAATFEGTGKDPWGGERASFTAETKIDRREFGLTWNAALEAGGVLVSNDVKIALEVQAVRA